MIMSANGNTFSEVNGPLLGRKRYKEMLDVKGDLSIRLIHPEYEISYDLINPESETGINASVRQWAKKEGIENLGMAISLTSKGRLRTFDVLDITYDQSLSLILSLDFDTVAVFRSDEGVLFITSPSALDMRLCYAYDETHSVFEVLGARACTPDRTLKENGKGL